MHRQGNFPRNAATQTRGLGNLTRGGLGVTLRMGDQDVPDMVGMFEDVKPAARTRHIVDVAQRCETLPDKVDEIVE